MAYFSGSAVDMAAVRAALVDACVTQGWSWDSGTEMLSKGAMFLRLQVVSGYLTLLGLTSASAGGAPNVVRIGQIGSAPITYPLSYEVFVFASEVFLVVNYSVDIYQWAAFGQSSVSGLSGSGMWVGASTGPTNDNAGVGVSITPTSGGAIGSDRTSAALFWSTVYLSGSQQAHRNAYVHSDLDGEGWRLNNAAATSLVGVLASAPLVGIMPNSWNSEAVLLPIRAYKLRPASKISLVADLENARYTRLDNYAPGEVITLGPDRWKVFPWYRKDASARNGFTGGSGVPHSGTLGWAIRYEGP
jgi:hypothetical protein